MEGAYDKEGRRQPLNVLCTREIQNSIKDSVYEELVNAIWHLGFNKWGSKGDGDEDEFDIKRDEIIHRPSNSKIIFMGLWTSVEKGSSKGKFDIRLTWCEEADRIQERSIRALEPTVLREEGSQIIYTSNVTHVTDAVYADSEYYKSINDPNVLVKTVNYKDNPFITNAFLKTIVAEKIKDPEFFKHDYLGYPYENTEFSVFKKGVHYEYGNMDEFVEKNELTPVYGMDYGQSEKSPSVILELYYIDENTYYISNTREAYGLDDRYSASLVMGNPKGRQDDWENPQGFTGLIDPLMRDAYRIYHDSANVNNIKELRRAGLTVIPATEAKKKDCVKLGIKHLQSKKLIVNDDKINPDDPKSPRRCEILIIELLNHKYGTLAGTKDVPDFKKFVDEYNHAIDCARYAIIPYYDYGGKSKSSAVATGHWKKRKRKKRRHF